MQTEAMKAIGLEVPIFAFSHSAIWSPLSAA